MPKYDVILKPVKPNQVISIRETLPNYPSVGQLFDELEKYLHLHHQDKPSNYYTAIWHDQGYQEQDVDGEAVIAIENQLVGNERIKVYELPGVETMACVVHHGSYKNLNLAYQVFVIGLMRMVIKLSVLIGSFIFRVGRNRIMKLM